MHKAHVAHGVFAVHKQNFIFVFFFNKLNADDIVQKKNFLNGPTNQLPAYQVEAFLIGFRFAY